MALAGAATGVGLAAGFAPSATPVRQANTAAAASFENFIYSLLSDFVRRRGTTHAFPGQHHVVDPQVLVVGGIRVALETDVEAVELRWREPLALEIAGPGRRTPAAPRRRTCATRCAVEPELEFVDAASRCHSTHAQRSTGSVRAGILLAIGGDGRCGFEIGHQAEAAPAFYAQAVDRVVAVVGGAAFALQQRPVHRRRAGQRFGAASSQTIARPYMPDMSAGSGVLQVDCHVAAAVRGAARSRVCAAPDGRENARAVSTRMVTPVL